MKISILTPDLSHNCLGRAHVLHGLLERAHDVEIIGPLYGDEIWAPLAVDSSIEIKSLKLERTVGGLARATRMLRLIEGDIVYASKPLYTSFGMGLMAKLLKGKPLLLDIDDWQVGFYQGVYAKENGNASTMSRLKNGRFYFNASKHYLDLLLDKLVFLADEVTSANKFLEGRYGGELIYHARDVSLLDPGLYEKNAVRRELGIGESRRIVMFLGTPRPYKGLDDLITAVSRIEDESLLLVIAGVDFSDPFNRKIVEYASETLSDRFMPYGFIPLSGAPRMIAAADIMAVPQKRLPETAGQIPAKLFDAMAMAKPVVTTDVSDARAVLGDCGIVVESENPAQLADAVEFLLRNPEVAREMGRKVRERCEASYSNQACASLLADLIGKYV